MAAGRASCSRRPCVVTPCAPSRRCTLPADCPLHTDGVTLWPCCPSIPIAGCHRHAPSVLPWPCLSGHPFGSACSARVAHSSLFRPPPPPPPGACTCAATPAPARGLPSAWCGTRSRGTGWAAAGWERAGQVSEWVRSRQHAGVGAGTAVCTGWLWRTSSSASTGPARVCGTAVPCSAGVPELRLPTSCHPAARADLPIASVRPTPNLRNTPRPNIAAALSLVLSHSMPPSVLNMLSAPSHPPCSST